MLFWLIALLGLLTSCSWVDTTGRNAPEGASTESWRGAGSTSTGADVGNER